MDALRAGERPALPESVEPGGHQPPADPDAAGGVRGIDPAGGRGETIRLGRLTGQAASRFSGQRIRQGFAASLASERERGLTFLFVPVALGCGAALYFSLRAEPAMFPVVLAFVVAGLLAVSAYRAGHGAAPLLMLAAMVFAGFGAARFEMRDPPVLLDGDVTTTVTGRVLRAEIDDVGKVRYLLDLAGTVDPVIRRPPDQVRLVARAGPTPFAIGETISGRARLSAPSGPVLPGGYDFAFSAFTQGIGAYGFFFSVPVEATPVQEAEDRGWRLAERVQSLRSAIAARVRSVVPGDPGAIAAALTVSDRRGISEQVVEDLRATGLAHVLSISGLHMALAAGIFYVGLRRLMALVPRLAETLPVKKIAAVGALGISTAYLVISDASVPTERSWLMLSVLMIAVIVDRPALTMRNVAIAATIIILRKPSAVMSPGFQMSFAATAALIAAYGAWARRGENRAERQGGDNAQFLKGGIVRQFLGGTIGLMATSIIAGLATGLFAAYHFHRVAAYGVIANLLAMPLVSFVIMPAGMVAMLTMPLGLDALPLKAMGLGIEGMMAVARFVADLGGNMVVGRMPLTATAIATAGFILLIYLRSALRLIGLAVVILGLLLAMPAFRPPLPDILVSEDGRLVGLLEGGVLATNAERPGSFVFEQWQMAMGGPAHQPPVMFGRDEKEALKLPPTLLEDGRTARTRYDPLRGLEVLVSRAEAAPGTFACLNRDTCAASYRGLLIAAIRDPAWIGEACDRAELVIVSVPVRITDCFSGAMLVTARELRRSGALTISLSPELPHEQADTETSPAARDAAEQSKVPDDRGGATGQMRIIAAIEGVVRPWTVHRYYDWRSDSFDLPPGRALPGVGEMSRKGIGEQTEAEPGELMSATAEQSTISAAP